VAVAVWAIVVLGGRRSTVDVAALGSGTATATLAVHLKDGRVMDQPSIAATVTAVPGKMRSQALKGWLAAMARLRVS
jgi:hypothetical protein